MSFSFMFYDLTFLIIFTLGIAWFLWAKRRKLGREGPLFLYRTKVGLKVIDKISKSCAWLLKPMAYVIVVLGYVLMALMFYFLFQLVNIFARPEYVQIIKVPPLMPVIPYLPRLFKIEWLPPLYFTYWIVTIAIVAIIHEGFHGIYSRLHDIKVKSTGFGFLGPILTFFVEPDEKQVKKQPIFKQLSILGAGVFGNILIALVFFLIMWMFFASAYTPVGALFNTYTYTQAPVSTLSTGIEIGEGQLQLDGMNLTEITLEGKTYYVWQGHLDGLSEYEEGYVNLYHDYPAIHSGIHGAISKINGAEIQSQDDIRAALDSHSPGDTISIQTIDDKEIFNYEIKLSEDYEQEGRPVMGIGVLSPARTGVRGFLFKVMSSFRDPTIEYEPKTNYELTEFVYYLLWWIVLVNIGVALFNILPLGMADGGRYWYLTVLALTKNEKIAKKSFTIITKVILAVFLLLMFLWFIGIM